MANKEKRFETIYTQGTSLSIVVDTETGVNTLSMIRGLPLCWIKTEQSLLLK